MSHIDIAIVLLHENILSDLVSVVLYVRRAIDRSHWGHRSPVNKCVIKTEFKNELLELALDLASSRFTSICIRGQDTQ